MANLSIPSKQLSDNFNLADFQSDFTALNNVKVEYVKSTTEPTQNLFDGLVWYNTNSGEKKIYFNGSFGTLGGGVLTVYLNTVTVTGIATNTVSIGIPSFNKYRDYLAVTQNNASITLNQDFTVSSDGLVVIKSSGTWAVGTRLDFICYGTADTAPDILGTVCLVSTFTSTADGTTNIKINNNNYNSQNDTLVPYYLGNGSQNIELLETYNYTKNADGLSIDLVGWSLGNGETIYFRCWKKIRQAANTTDGSLIQTGSIPKSALVTAVQTTLDSVANKTDKTQEAWNTANLINSWAHFGAPYYSAGYMKDNFGFVHLRGVIKSGTVTAGTIIFTLPVGYRPSNNMIIIVSTNNATPFGTIIIKSDGTVTADNVSNAYLALDNIQFKAEQ